MLIRILHNAKVTVITQANNKLNEERIDITYALVVQLPKLVFWWGHPPTFLSRKCKYIGGRPLFVGAPDFKFARGLV